MKSVPKIIWVLWLQGWNDAPPIVQNCLASWRTKNPGWKVICLDAELIQSYIDLSDILEKNEGAISSAALSDIIRIELLADYGGVWVDATCYCNKPLDLWLGKVMKEDFFAFRNTSKDKPLASWFLVANDKSYVAREYSNEVRRFWTENGFSNQKYLSNKIVSYLLSKLVYRRLVSRNYSGKEFLWILTGLRLLKIYPYFWFHYSFARILVANDSVREIWNRVPDLSSGPAHQLQRLGLFSKIREEDKVFLSTSSCPVYKLNWKIEGNLGQKDTVLDYLFYETSSNEY